MKTINAEQTCSMLDYVADQIITSKPYLTQVDAAIGDGDHGIGMAYGMEKVKSALQQPDIPMDPYSIFALAGSTMLMSMGGASGVIFGSLYQGGAKKQPPKACLTCEDLAELFARSLRVIQDRGGAKAGDKTMVDALEPAVNAMLENRGGDMAGMLEAAAQAAQAGMEATKNYTAKFGRAKSLMERAIGHPDAGAASVWIIFRSMAEWARQADPQP